MVVLYKLLNVGECHQQSYTTVSPVSYNNDWNYKIYP